ncbi:hypothetical protein RALTA_B0010 [Cupriavidus taiwanensis LMG 19424]|uniref:Uncharacterized protein n=1 Tax=Cupriavidus taiwanensis (strain DSM 17343 / BCRC 17206 / CCUG 44338 / CIP 107171 / LMG 19424 / R1) TaxID=977880 RepID=B2AHG6_CUPTR|nr:hypothetical protein RALTA_B0010 [Cupriavidus taiwanensis LMG 19424]
MNLQARAAVVQRHPARAPGAAVHLCEPAVRAWLCGPPCDADRILDRTVRRVVRTMPHRYATRARPAKKEARRPGDHAGFENAAR